MVSFYYRDINAVINLNSFINSEAKVTEKSVCTEYKRGFLFFWLVLYAEIGMMLKYRPVSLTCSNLECSYSRYILKIEGEDG